MERTTIVIYKFRRELKEIVIIVDSQNRYPARFAIEKELKLIKKRLERYKKRGIINSIIPRNPKIKDRHYRKKIKNILYSRNSLKRALKLISMIRGTPES